MVRELRCVSRIVPEDTWKGASSPSRARLAANLEAVRRALALAFLLLALSLSLPAFATDCDIICDVAEPVCGQEVTFRVACGYLRMDWAQWQPGAPFGNGATVRMWIVFADGRESEYFTGEQELHYTFETPGTYYVKASANDMLGTSLSIVPLEVRVGTASASPPPAVVPDTAGVLFEERFSGDVSDWSSGDSGEFVYGVEDGRYFIIARKDHWSRWTWVPLDDISFDRLAVSVDVVLSSSSEGHAGILWGTDVDNFYVFLVDEEGRYNVSWQEDDEWQTQPASWTSHAALNAAPGENRLQLRLDGDTVVLLANDEVLDAVTIDNFEEGRLALYTGMYSSEDPYCQAWFDNLCITDQPENLGPTAAFSNEYSTDDSRRVTFDASGSRDPDGRIVRYTWSFGDGDSGSGETVTHTYTSQGTYTVRLTVRDDEGAEDQTSRTVTISNRPPWPSFTFSPTDPVEGPVRFDASGSRDEDGTIDGYEWDFGDGSAGSGIVATHTYTEAGTYMVTLTVTDNDGAEMSGSKVVSVQEGNESPVAHFTWDVVGEDGTRLMVEARVGKPVRFDASASSDPDGEIVEYAWDWDTDGVYDETTTAPTIDHWFEEPGERPVTLQVTDDGGATGTYAEPVSIAAEPQIVEPDGVWALVVGISDYADVSNLTYARSDAEAFARWLVGSGVSPDSITLLLDEAGELKDLGLSYEEATLSRFRAGLGQLRKKASADDLVFVYFAGHGYQGEDDDGDEADGVDEFLVLYDTMRSAVEETALRDDEFGEFLDRVGSEHVMVVFDSCHSGGQSRSLSSGARPLGDAFDLFNDFSLEGKLILAAAREDQEALEHEGLGHGLFTHFLLQGLEGEADLDSDYRITAEELHAYVSAEVERFAWEERGREQTPEMTGRGEVGIVLGRTNRPPEASFTVAPEVPYAHGATHFTDASTDDVSVVSWGWDLGDGATAAEQHATHVYEEAGSYPVALTVEDGEGATSTIEHEVAVAPPGEVTVVSGEMVVISLGNAHGIEIGDRFRVLRLLELSSGAVIEEQRATIEVIEILGADRSACTMTEAAFPIEVGDLAVPI